MSSKKAGVPDATVGSAGADVAGQAGGSVASDSPGDQGGVASGLAAGRAASPVIPAGRVVVLAERLERYLRETCGAHLVRRREFSPAVAVVMAQWEGEDPIRVTLGPELQPSLFDD